MVCTHKYRLEQRLEIKVCNDLDLRGGGDGGGARRLLVFLFVVVSYTGSTRALQATRHSSNPTLNFNLATSSITLVVSHRPGEGGELSLCFTKNPFVDAQPSPAGR